MAENNRFDDMMFDIAREQNDELDFEALKTSIKTERPRRLARRSSFVRYAALAAAAVVVCTAASIAALNENRDSAKLMAAAPAAAAAPMAPAPAPAAPAMDAAAGGVTEGAEPAEPAEAIAPQAPSMQGDSEESGLLMALAPDGVALDGVTPDAAAPDGVDAGGENGTRITASGSVDATIQIVSRGMLTFDSGHAGMEFICDYQEEDGTFCEEYLYNDSIGVVIERLAPRPYDADAPLEAVLAREYGAKGITVNADDAVSNRLTYPAWRVDYTTGANEDKRICTDIYVQAELNDFRFHIGIPADIYEESSALAEQWISTLMLVE